MININQVKIQNRKLVFKEILARDYTTRIEISKKVNLSVATISSIVEEFVKAGIVMEVKDEKSTVGRKPNMLQFRPEAQKMICIDLSSKQFAYAVKNLSLLSEKLVVHEFDESLSYEENLLQFCQGIKHIIETEYNKRDLIGIGISVPGPYNQAEDRVINKLIPEIGGLSIHRFFSEHFSLPFQIDQDVKYAAKAEVQYIDNYETKSVFFMYLGEGVGGAISIKDDIYGGAQEFAGDIGQMIVNESSNLEQQISWKRFVLQAKNHYKLSNIDNDYLLAKWSEKETWLLGEIDKITHYLSIAITNVAWLLNPHVIVIGGAYNIFGRLFIEKIMEKMTDRFPELFDHMQILLSHYDENSALVGAGSMVRENWLDKLSSGNSQ